MSASEAEVGDIVMVYGIKIGKVVRTRRHGPGSDVRGDNRNPSEYGPELSVASTGVVERKSRFAIALSKPGES